jgi:predicted metal-binding membrane protein
MPSITTPTEPYQRGRDKKQQPGSTVESRMSWRPSDKAFVIFGVAAVIIGAWAYVVPASLDMYGRMDGAAAWMMEATWDARYLALMFLMWAVMMVAMMLPSALPSILIFQRAIRNDPTVRSPARRMLAFAAGYVVAWSAFSIAATLLQWALAEAALLSPMMVSVSPRLGGAILIAAGLYQWTPLKNACLRHCRSPLAFLVEHWQPGVPGALRLGMRHGLHCIGCCWALMLLLFVGGVMSLLWIAGITAFVLLEKLAPHGVQGGRLSGLGLMLCGVWVLMSA